MQTNKCLKSTDSQQDRLLDRKVEDQIAKKKLLAISLLFYCKLKMQRVSKQHSNTFRCCEHLLLFECRLH